MIRELTHVFALMQGVRHLLERNPYRRDRPRTGESEVHVLNNRGDGILGSYGIMCKIEGQ